MPGRYSDAFPYVAGNFTYPDSAPDERWTNYWCQFTSPHPCPESEACQGSTASRVGVVSGLTLEECRREFAAWMADPAYDAQRHGHENDSVTYVFLIYDRNTNTYHPAIAPRPLTPEEIARNKKMMNVKLTRESGKLYLTVDAAGLHETLDAIGCQTQTAGGNVRYVDRPYTTVSVLDPATHTLSTELLLTKGVQKVDLSTVYNRPPSAENLKKLANSAYEKCRTILEHYQPIDIQVSIQKKVLAGA